MRDSSAESQRAATIISKDNVVEVAVGNGSWSSAATGQSLNPGDRLRTGEDSRAVVRISDGSVLQLDELTTIEMKFAQDASGRPALRLPMGAAFFLNGGGRGRELQIETPGANGAIRGTAFLLKVNGVTGQTTVSMLDGAFQLSNVGGSVTARRGEQAGSSPMGTPAKDVLNELGSSAPWYLVIEHDLPSVKTLHSTSRGEFFGALPASIKQWRHVSPQLAGSATIVRKEWAHDILRASFSAVGSDCELRAKILRSVIAADPADASGLTALALEISPQCAAAFKLDTGAGGDVFDSGNPPGNPGPLSTLTGGGGQGNVIAICHNGQTIFLSPAGAQNFLRQHPGAVLGSCQVTPTQNR